MLTEADSLLQFPMIALAQNMFPVIGSARDPFKVAAKAEQSDLTAEYTLRGQEAAL